jgi:hypothetical protein
VAVLQDEVEFAVRDGLKLKDAVNIDNGRSMNADEAHGIETIGELIEGGSVKQLLAGDVQIGIDPCTFDPVDVGHANEARRTAGLYHQPIKVPASPRPGGDHAHDAPAELLQTPLVVELLGGSLGDSSHGF